VWCQNCRKQAKNKMSYLTVAGSLAAMLGLAGLGFKRRKETK
jgi:LPXTG-motif cell wall-anchored protein